MKSFYRGYLQSTVLFQQPIFWLVMYALQLKNSNQLIPRARGYNYVTETGSILTENIVPYSPDHHFETNHFLLKSFKCYKIQQ